METEFDLRGAEILLRVVFCVLRVAHSRSITGEHDFVLHHPHNQLEAKALRP